MARKALLAVGEPAPWIAARCTSLPQLQLESLGGRYVVLFFFGSINHPPSQTALRDFLQHRAVFDDVRHTFLGVSIDPENERADWVRELPPRIHFLWDFDRSVSREFGAVFEDSQAFRPHTVVLDTRLRALAVVPLTDGADHVRRVIEILEQAPPVGAPTLAAVQAPVLVIPRVFEPGFCRKLIAYYEELGGKESGFMREIGGKTVGVYDSAIKRRRDQDILDETLRKSCMYRIHGCVAPEIQKAFQFRAKFIERYIVACYDETSKGFFHAHRDNTTKATAHRRFAVSLNLNTGEFEGGCLRFPEFGPQLYVPPAGGAVVFSCSLLHEATPVTAGKRYAFLPFLYDEEAAQTRRENAKFLAGDIAPPENDPNQKDM
jgi:peroxiredoxin